MLMRPFQAAVVVALAFALLVPASAQTCTSLLPRPASLSLYCWSECRAAGLAWASRSYVLSAQCHHGWANLRPLAH